MRGKTALLVVVLIFGTCLQAESAVSWHGDVGNTTDGSSWSIDRRSATINFDFSGFSEGVASPIVVTPEGRLGSLATYHYLNLESNEVRLKERTSASNGTYSSEDEISLKSEADEDVDMWISKRPGTGLYRIEWSERWPVILNASRSVDFVGKGINDRECIGNNFDGIVSTYLYNVEFNKEREASLQLERLNATVIATNDVIVETNFLPTKSTDYRIESHSTGIADLRYWQTDSSQKVISLGEERYHGTYDITRNLNMRSVFINDTEERDWLSCCVGGLSGVDPCDYNGLKIFDCVVS